MSQQPPNAIYEKSASIFNKTARMKPNCLRQIWAAKIKWIAQVDFTGSPRDHVGEGLRCLPFRKRIIYYRSYPDRIVIMRVLHSAQDVTRQEFEEK